MKIEEISLELIPKNEHARNQIGFRWAEGNVGKRSKIGGSPDFLGEAEIPSCDCCDQSMTFYAQIDSIGDEFVLADVGMVYVFVCFGCFETKSVLQSG